jgi:hypothetical protein
MASSISRVTGGVTAGEYAANLDALKSLGRAEPDIYAKTESQLREEARVLHDKLTEENTPWYIGGQFDFLKKIFGEERRGTVQSMLTRKGVGNLRKVHDLAVESDPKNPNAGIDAVAEYLSMIQRVQMTGIETQADSDLFNAGVKSGDIVRKQRGDAVRFFASRDALTKDNYNKLVQQTGIKTLVDIDNVESERIGELLPTQFAKNWSDLTPNEKNNFSKRWHSKSMSYLEEKYNFLKELLQSGQLQDITLYETLPFIAVGTSDQFSLHGYEIDNTTDVFDEQDGKKRYVMDISAVSSPDGEEVDISTHAPNWAIAEDIIESKLKQSDPGLLLNDPANEWMNSIQADIKAKGEKATVSEKRIAKMLASKTGRFEFLVKTYYMNRLGYDVQADRFSKALTDYQIPEDVHRNMIALVGEDLLNAVARTPIVREARGVREQRVRQILEERPAGGITEARRLVTEGATDELVNQLGTALGQDMRTAENRQAVQDVLDQMDREGVTFALSSTFDAEVEFQQLKRAVETGDIRDIARYAARFWIKVPGKPSMRVTPPEQPRQISPVPRPAEIAETRLPTGESVRREREIPGVTPEFAEPIFSPEELEDAAPAWLTGAALENWINNYEEVSPEDIARQAKEQNPDIKRSIEDMVRDLEFVPARLQATLPRYQRPEARVTVMPERRVRGGRVVPAVPTVSGAPFAVEAKTARFDLSEQEFMETEETEKNALDEIFGEEPTSAEETQSRKELTQQQKVMRKVQGRTPRASWKMQPLNAEEPIAGQIQDITVVGMHDMSRFGETLKDRFKNAILHDFVYIPKGVPINRLMGWISQQTKQGWNPVVLRSQNAIFDEAADVEGWIAILDWDLEERMASPIQRAIFTAHTGYIPQGRIYRAWQYRETAPGQYEALEMIDSDEITAQIEEPIGGPIDFIHPIYGTPDAFQSAVFPMLSNRGLARVAELEGAQKRAAIDNLAFNLHDWIRRNKIRKLGIIGMPSVETTGTRTWRVSDPFRSGGRSFRAGDIITYPNERVVPARWIPALSQVISRAVSPDIMKATRPATIPAERAEPIEITPEMQADLERDIAEGRGTFSLTPAYITNRIRFRYNNQVSAADAQIIGDAVSGLYRGDELALGQVQRMLLSQDWERMGAGLTAINRRARGEDEPQFIEEVQPELPFEEEQETTALAAIENLYEDLDPAFRGGALGFHKLMLEQGRQLRTIKYEEDVFVDNLNKRLGYETPSRQLPENHKEIADNMLSAVGAVLDGSKRIPVRAGQWEDPQEFIRAWDTHVEANNLDMPKAQEVIDLVRNRYEQARKKANQIMETLTDEEWIRYLTDYVNHQYRAKTRREIDDIVRRMAEEAKTAKERRLPTYEQAAEQRGLFPITMNAISLYKSWNNVVWTAARNKSMTSIASTVRDADGAPIVVPVKMGGQVESEDQLIDDKILRENLKYLAAYLEKEYDSSKDSALEIERLVGEMDVEQEGYVRMDSPLTKSVDFFLVRKGTTEDIMKTVLNYGRIDNTLMRGIERFNAWSKFMMLSFSGFHPFALAESLSAVFGVQTGNPAFHIPSTYKKLKDLVADMKENPEKYKPWYEAGYTGDVGNPDVRLGIIEQDMQRALDRLEEKGGYVEKIMKPGIKGMQQYKHWLDRWLWHQFLPAIKMHSAEWITLMLLKKTKWKHVNRSLNMSTLLSVVLSGISSRGQPLKQDNGFMSLCWLLIGPCLRL